MVFSSLTFLYIFLPVCLILYFSTKNINQKNIVLLIMSLIFYAWGEPIWIILMIVSTLVEFFGAKIVDRYRNTWKAKAAVFISIAVSLSFLFIFKYYDFVVVNINSMAHTSIKLLGLTLPIGISFYTFQIITYIIDVYREKAPVQNSFPKLLLYVSMFPQLIAGPIVKYSDVANQIEDRSFDIKKTGDGVKRFLVGLTKKAIFANLAGEVATKFLDGNLDTLSMLGAWIGIVAYTLQIYFDFSAYSDMAIGLGKIFGFDYPENFNHPYIAKSITDFWTRWHISLTTFFREYLYIPLGGNRKHHVFNLLLVWLFTGLWHGASFNFLLWGLYYYILIVSEKLFLGKLLDRIPNIFAHIYTMYMVIIGWIFFYFDDMGRLRQFLSIFFGFSGNPFMNVTDKAVLMNQILFFIIAIIATTEVPMKLKEIFLQIREKNTFTQYTGSIVMILFFILLLFVNTAAIVGSTYNPFLYFRF